MNSAVQPDLSLPDAIWNPIQSASAATTFSAFLSGIVLSAMVQIGISQAKSGIDRASSLRFSAVALVGLLTATYMFILLAGVTPLSDALDVRLRVVAKAGLLFAIAGTVLAVGAVLTLALMFLIFGEWHGKGRGVIAIEAVKAVLFLGAATAGVFLVFGYDDIYRLTAGGADMPWFLWVVMILLIYAPECLVLHPASRFPVARKARPSLMRVFRAPTEQLAPRPAILAACWLFVLPTMAYLVVSHVVDSSSTVLAGTITAICAAWAGVSLASLLVVATEKRKAHSLTAANPSTDGHDVNQTDGAPAPRPDGGAGPGRPVSKGTL